MMTPDKNFKMWSSTKTQMALMKGSKEDKNHYKKMMIDAQLCFESAKRAALKSKDHNEGKGKSRGAVAPE
jgi:hypothetical protein